MGDANNKTNVVPESAVESFVVEVSNLMKNPQYAQMAVGTFVQSHPDVSRYLTASAKELGGSESVVHAVFHSQVLAGCWEKYLGRELPAVGFADLDAVSGDDAIGRFRKVQPALADYLIANVEELPLQSAVAHVGLALHRVTSNS